ncbi:phosphoribulokinase [Hahella ganghwensis]|uniref:phosphoribulokinase n=1 Tax=Hahella ganghwensis TaxID=286420 RepID=UPI0003735353|nr:phosphoribulokinase [Hahella ganghwensis]
MSTRHPIIALTGSSGAGTTTSGLAMQKIFKEEKIRAAVVEGDSYHRYTRDQMAALASEGKYGHWNHFSPAANYVDKLEALFADYAASGSGRYRHYVHDEDMPLLKQGYQPGTFTPWRDLPSDTDCLFYEGLHGGLKVGQYNVVRHVDLLIGVAPIVNLEWIQKIYRDTHVRGCSKEAVVSTILNRMEDYVRYIVPQFARTDINFQRVPTVDTSDPFIMQDIPSEDESMVVIRFKHYQEVDFPYLINMIPDAFISRYDTIVIPGNKLTLAMDFIVRPRVIDLVEAGRKV